MPKYIVRVGGNAPDPTGKRDEKGRPVEVRFDEGAEITEKDVSPAALATLLKSEAIAIVEPPSDMPYVETPVVTLPSGANTSMPTNMLPPSEKAKK